MNYPEFIAEWRGPETFIVCHTSGSTGTPKRILLPKSRVGESARRTINFFGIDSGSRLHSCISPDFIGGKMMAVRAELAGCSLTWEQPSNRPLENYTAGAIDLLAVVPSQMLHILDMKAGGRCPELRNVIIGGAPIPPGLRADIAASGIKAWETYGMTETASHIALRRVTAIPQPFSTLGNIGVYLNRDSCLIIDMPGWQRLATNDIAYIPSPGKFEILGRADNVIITGGKKVHPERVEETIEAILRTEALITSQPDEKWGSSVVLVLDPASRWHSLYEDNDIISILRHSLQPECTPKKIEWRPIPKTPNGKKKRR